MYDVLERLVATRYEDINVYVELMKAMCERYAGVCTWNGVAEDGSRGDVVARVALESRDERDGYIVSTDHCTGVISYERERERCLTITLAHIHTRPPSNILGYAPVMIVPLWLIDEVIVNAGPHSFSIKQPAHTDFTLTVHGKKIEVLLEKFEMLENYIPDYGDEEPETIDVYVVRINWLG